MKEEISKQLYEKNITVLIGGGRRHFIPTSEGGTRRDGRNLLNEFRDKKGYQVISTGKEFFNTKLRTPFFGALSHDQTPYEVDRNNTENPSLLFMVQKGLELLIESDKEKRGFFLLIEGSRIDHAMHNNDIASATHELLMFDKTYEYIHKFAEKDPDTLIISTSDHETGGMSILGGFNQNSLNMIKETSMSTEKLREMVNAGQDIRNLMRQHLKINPTDIEVNRIKNELNTPNYFKIMGEIIYQRNKIHFSTTSHSGDDVPLFSNMNVLNGMTDNTEVAKTIKNYLNLNF
jgi:alkaline phosphatase